MALIEITGPTRRDGGAGYDPRPWKVRAAAYQAGGDGGVITPGGKAKTVYPVAGVLTLRVEAGISFYLENPDGDDYLLTAPEADSELWDVIEAGVAFPPDTSQEQLNVAVAQYVETNRNQFKTRAVPITTGPDAGLYQWVDANDDPIGDPVELAEVISESIAEAAATAAATTVTPGIVTADLEARDPQVVDGVTPNTSRFKLGDAYSTEFPKATTWTEIGLKPIKSITEFGAVADGTYNPGTGAMTGTDNTDAINDALEYGSPVLVPPGMFYYSGVLHTDVNGSGLTGSGSRVSFLITDQSMDRHIAVVEGTQDTRWTGFAMIGPHITDGDDYNRALVVGVNSALTAASTSAWDASGTWIDDFITHGYCTGLHVAFADNVQFGTIEVHEAGDPRAEPGSYGVSCSGSNLRGRLLRAVNTTTRGRHALYYTGPANDCYVDAIEASGFDYAAIQNRVTTGGGKRNGFGFGRFEDCNTNQSGEETTLRGVVNFVCANDTPVAGAGGALIGDMISIDCGGFPGPSLRYMPNSRCGTVQVYGHSGDFTATGKYGAHIFQSPDVELPRMNFVSGFDAAGLNDAAFELLVVEQSPRCSGGGVRSHSGAVFQYGLHAISCVGVHVPELILAGTYQRAVRWAGTTDYCVVDSVTPLDEPTLGLISDASTGFQHSRVMRAPGYDMKTVTSGTTIDVTGYREIRLNYGSSTTVTNLTGLQQSVPLKITAMNANATLAYFAGGAGELALAGGANINLGTRHGFVVSGHITGSGGSYTSRCIESNPKLPLGQLVNDTTTALGVGSLNIGHPSDTTVSRVSAGRIAVEGVTVPLMLTASLSLNFPSVAAQSFQDLTIPVTGAVLGDVVAISTPTAAVTAGIAFTAWVSAADTVTVRAHNYTAGALDPAAGTFRATIIR